jgi:hypothetical protein
MEEDTSLAFAAGLGLGTHTQYEINDDAGGGGLGGGGGFDSEMLSNAIAQSAEVGVLTQARTSAILNSILIPDDVVSTIMLLKSGDNSYTSSGGGGGKRRGMTCVTDAVKLVMMISEAVSEVKSAQTLIEESMAIEAGDKGCATQ